MEKQTKKYIDISPHRSILTKISQTGYSVQEALAELVDNAVDARVEGKKLSVFINIIEDAITVSDDGKGMTEGQAANAIRLGYSEKKEQLGEFGLGLKTATSFLGKEFTLITTPKDSSDEYMLEYNEDEWLEKGDWNKYPFVVNHGVDAAKSGTTIIVRRLKINIPQTLSHRIRDEFGARFGPFIKNGELDLFFNDDLCPPGSSSVIDDKKSEFTFEFKGGKATGWWGYQVSGLNKSYYGFQTFRRGRLVTTFDKIGLTPNQDIKQIIGELHIEGIPITHDKKGWLKSSREYQELEALMREHFKPFEKRPKRILSGFPASSGKVVGIARIVMMLVSSDMEKDIGRIKKGDIIVTVMTRPQYLLGIRRAAGIVTTFGGHLCHAAIVAREFNIPAVVGTQTATSTLRDGQRIILDGNDGNIYDYED